MSDTFLKESWRFFRPDEIRLIFENSRRYFEAAQSIEGLILPKPLSFSDTGLVFEKIPDMEETLKESWFREKRWNADLCNRIGYFLGRLHKAQGNLHDKIFIHGDFVPHNIVIRESDTVVFDSEPPGRYVDFMRHYHNYNYVDLASFVFFIIISHSFKCPWRFFRNKRSFIASFLQGYETGATFSCDPEVLWRYLKEELYKWYHECPHFVFRKWIEYGILRAAFFAQGHLYCVFS